MPFSEGLLGFETFMNEYIRFMEQMIHDESEKLSALNQKDLTKIEHNIVVSLANAKKLENFEQKRQQEMEQLGYGGLTFKEMIDKAPEEARGPLQVLFTRFEHTVQEIKFQNDKAMEVAQDNLALLNPEAALALSHKDKPQNEYERMREKAAGQGGLLEQKA